MTPHTRRALADLLEGPRAWRLWWLLAWSDVRQRYARSLLGPWWLTISNGLIVACIGVLYGFLFRSDIKDYIPYLAIGYILWFYILTSIQEGMTTLIVSDGICRQINIHYSVLFSRTVFRNIIVFAHNFAIIVAALAIFEVTPSAATPLAIFGLAIVTAILYFSIFPLAIFCTRYRDVIPLIQSVFQLLFYVSPILWSNAALPPQHQYIATINPLFHIIEVVRAPLLGHAPTMTNYYVSFLVFLFAVISTFYFMIKYRRRIPYWL